MASGTPKNTHALLCTMRCVPKALAICHVLTRVYVQAASGAWMGINSSLIALVLWGLSVDLSSGLSLRKLAGEVSKDMLVSCHLHSQTLEVRELGGKTNSVCVHEHEVAGPAFHLIDLECTSALHGDLELGDEVLAQTQWPPVLDFANSADVLVHEAVDLGDSVVDLDLAAGEDERDLGQSVALALSRLGLHVGNRCEGLEQIANGRKVAALALLDVVCDQVCCSTSVCLEGQVVVSNLVALALHSSEHVVCHVLHAGADGGQEGPLLLLDAEHGGLLHSLDLGLTNLDGFDDVLVEVSNHTVTNTPDGFAACLGCSLPVHGQTSGMSEVLLVPLGVGSDSVGEGGHTGAKLLLGVSESISGLRLGIRELTLESLNSFLLSGFVVRELLVQLLGSLGEVPLEARKVLVLEVTGVLKSSLSLVLQGQGLLSSSSLVLVHDLLEHTASALVRGEVCVGPLEKCVDLLLHPLVHSILDSPLLDDGTGHGHDVALDLGLDLLELGHGISNARGHHLLGVCDVRGRCCLGCLNVCHGLGETLVLESGVLSNLFVELSDCRCEVVGNLLCVICHLFVDLDEASVGLLRGLINAILHSLHDLVLVSELLVEPATAAVLVLLSHSLAVLVILTAHDTNLLAHFLPVGQEGLVLFCDSVVESISSVLLVSID